MVVTLRSEDLSMVVTLRFQDSSLTLLVWMDIVNVPLFSEWNTRAKTILERLHSVKNDSNFEIAALFTTYTARGKGRQFQNWNYF